MDLHGIVKGSVGAVNPFILATVRVSTGYETGADGSQTPKYDTYDAVPIQFQAMSYRDLAQIDGLNLNGTRRKIYVSGELDATVRSKMKGGDLIDVAGGANAGVWLVAVVLEQWPDWCSVAVTLQEDAP